MGAPEAFFARCLKRAEDDRVPRAVLFESYRAWCATQELEPVEGRAFAKRFMAACDAAGVEWIKDDGKVCIARMRLVA